MTSTRLPYSTSSKSSEDSKFGDSPSRHITQSSSWHKRQHKSSSEKTIREERQGHQHLRSIIEQDTQPLQETNVHASFPLENKDSASNDYFDMIFSSGKVPWSQPKKPKPPTNTRTSVQRENKNGTSGSYFDKIFGSGKASWRRIKKPQTPSPPAADASTHSEKSKLDTTNSYFEMIFNSGNASWRRAKEQDSSAAAKDDSDGDHLSESKNGHEHGDGMRNCGDRRKTSGTGHQLQGEALGRKRDRKRKQRLKSQELEQQQRRQRTQDRIKQARLEEKDQKRAKLEAKRQEKLEDKLKRRIETLERYLENPRFQNRLDRDAVIKELDNWKSELNKPREERISLEDFKKRLQRKLKSHRNDRLKDEFTDSKVQDVQTGGSELPQENSFLIKKKRKRIAESEEKRQRKRAKKEAEYVEKVQKKLERNYIKEVERRQKRITVLERIFSNVRSKYRPEMPDLWEELYTLKQQEQERLIQEFESGHMKDATQLLILPVYSLLHQELYNREIRKMEKEIQNIEHKLANPRARYDLPALNQKLKRLKAEHETALGYRYRAQLERGSADEERQQIASAEETSKSNDTPASRNQHSSGSSPPFPPPSTFYSEDNDDNRVLVEERPFRRPNDNYIKFYNRFVCETLDPANCIPELPLSSLKINYNGTYPNETKYPGQYWSGEEKELFFTLLARYSIHQLDMISLHMGKSELEIITYYNLLKQELNKLKKVARRSGQVTGLKNWDYRLVQYEEIPAAYEMLKYFTKLEDEQSLLIDAKGENGTHEVEDNDDKADDTLLNKAHLSKLLGRICDDESLQVMADLVKQLTKNILINVVNIKTKKRLENDSVDATTINIFPRNIKSSLTQLGYSHPNAVFNCGNPLVKKVYSEQYGQHRWFSNLQNIISVPAFGNLVPLPRKATIPTIHNLHQLHNNDSHSNEDTLNDELESKLIELETKTIDEHDLLELRMYEHALLLMLLDGKTDVSPGDIKRLNRWNREFDLEERQSKGELDMGEITNGELTEDESEDVYDSTDALKAYSRQFPQYNNTGEEQLVERTMADYFEGDREELSTSSSEYEDDNDDHDDNDDNDDGLSVEDYNVEDVVTKGHFDEFFIRNYE